MKITTEDLNSWWDSEEEPSAPSEQKPNQVVSKTPEPIDMDSWWDSAESVDLSKPDTKESNTSTGIIESVTDRIAAETAPLRRTAWDTVAGVEGLASKGVRVLGDTPLMRGLGVQDEFDTVADYFEQGAKQTRAHADKQFQPTVSGMDVVNDITNLPQFLTENTIPAVYKGIEGYLAPWLSASSEAGNYYQDKNFDDTTSIVELGTVGGMSYALDKIGAGTPKNMKGLNLADKTTEYLRRFIGYEGISTPIENTTQNYLKGEDLTKNLDETLASSMIMGSALRLPSLPTGINKALKDEKLIANIKEDAVRDKAFQKSLDAIYGPSSDTGTSVLDGLIDTLDVGGKVTRKDVQNMGVLKKSPIENAYDKFTNFRDRKYIQNVMNPVANKIAELDDDLDIRVPSIKKSFADGEYSVVETRLAAMEKEHGKPKGFYGSTDVRKMNVALERGRKGDKNSQGSSKSSTLAGGLAGALGGSLFGGFDIVDTAIGAGVGAASYGAKKALDARRGTSIRLASEEINKLKAERQTLLMKASKTLSKVEKNQIMRKAKSITDRIAKLQAQPQENNDV